ncbi:hypothetical protein GWI33_020237, partial [Rhynchophorus ferrugineus]
LPSFDLFCRSAVTATAWHPYGTFLASVDKSKRTVIWFPGRVAELNYSLTNNLCFYILIVFKNPLKYCSSEHVGVPGHTPSSSIIAILEALLKAFFLTFHLKFQPRSTYLTVK